MSGVSLGIFNTYWVDEFIPYPPGSCLNLITDQGLIRQLVHEEVVELEGFFMADGGVAPVRIEELVEINTMLSSSLRT